ncbi:unnamed protein product [Amoebophrya sp. A120]|nr:unnamed protein product [Amoebophrya sp. A120]|eukprot:GSA120T00017221001.1
MGNLCCAEGRAGKTSARGSGSGSKKFDMTGGSGVSGSGTGFAIPPEMYSASTTASSTPAGKRAEGEQAQRKSSKGKGKVGGKMKGPEGEAMLAGQAYNWKSKGGKQGYKKGKK